MRIASGKGILHRSINYQLLPQKIVSRLNNCVFTHNQVNVNATNQIEYLLCIQIKHLGGKRKYGIRNILWSLPL